MDELEISGKRYISSRRAAREHKYHSDYIGQLIRAKKVVGQKVGRSWYVDEESLDRYLGRETVILLEPTKAEEHTSDTRQAEPEVIEPRHDLTANLERQFTAGSITNEPSALNLNEQPTREPSIPKIGEYKIPIQLVSPHDTARNKGLTYVSDTTSPLPEISKSDVYTQDNFHVSTNLVHNASSRQVDTEKRSNIGSVIGLLTLGLLTFFALSASAYVLNHKTTVENSNVTASVTLGYW